MSYILRRGLNVRVLVADAAAVGADVVTVSSIEGMSRSRPPKIKFVLYQGGWTHGSLMIWAGLFRVLSSRRT